MQRQVPSEESSSRPVRLTHPVSQRTRDKGWGNRNSCLGRRFRAEDALEAFAVLKKDQYPQYRGHQSRSNARRRHRQVEREDVVELRSKQCQGKWHEVAGE